MSPPPPSPTSGHWYPSSLFTTHPRQPYALVILNQPINKNALSAVIEGASLLICADGGANRLYQYDHQQTNDTTTTNGLPPRKLTRRIPDAIVGDLDSLADDVRAHYYALGVEVFEDPDQYSTDFTKCLKFIRQWASSRGQDGDTMDVVVLGGLGGRVDQGFSQIHHLFKAENDRSLLKGRIYLLSEQSLSFVLSSGASSTKSANSNTDNGTATIHLEPGYFAENVGILPVLGRTFLTTKGLEWDVQNWASEFGGQVSTSNHIRAETIVIQYQGPAPLFTLELEKHLTASGE